MQRINNQNRIAGHWIELKTKYYPSEDLWLRQEPFPYYIKTILNLNVY